MKESKFIELLNLYVDHQINPAEAALLETEVRSNPGRRRIYREYCQIQKGCTELAANFRSQAPASENNVVEFPARRQRWSATAYVAGLAAVAACAAVVFTLRPKQPEQVAAISPAKSVSAPVAVVTAPRPALQPVFGPRLLTVREQNSELAEGAGEPPAFAEWMNGIQFSSMPGASADELRFDSHANLQPDVRTYRSSRPIQGKVEWTAFTFQK